MLQGTSTANSRYPLTILYYCTCPKSLFFIFFYRCRHFEVDLMRPKSPAAHYVWSIKPRISEYKSLITLDRLVHCSNIMGPSLSSSAMEKKKKKIGNNTVLQLTWNKWVQSVEAEQMFGDDFPHSYTHNQASGRHWPSMNWRPASVRVRDGTHSKRKKNKLLSDAWSKRPSSCSEHSASCSGAVGGESGGGRSGTKDERSVFGGPKR